MPFPPLPTLFFGLLPACAGAGDLGKADSGDPAPDPWTELEARELETPRWLFATELPNRASPTALHTLPGLPLTAILDREAGGVHILDARHHHDPARHCLDPGAWTDPDVGPQGDCPEGQVQAQRGWLRLDAGVIAVAADRARDELWLLDGDGALWRSPAEPMGTAMSRLLRPEATGWAVIPGTADAHMAAHDGILAVGIDAHLTTFGEAATLEEDLGAPILDLAHDGQELIILTAQSLHRGSAVQTLDMAPLDLDWGGGLVFLGHGDRVDVHQADTLAPSHSISTPTGTGPIAWDATAQHLHIATASGIESLSGEGESLGSWAGDAPLDLAIGGPHEILSLGPRVEVLVDEVALDTEAPALPMWISTFAENPKEEAVIPCRGSDESLALRVQTARANELFLEDLPATIALGITPTVAREIQRCDAVESFKPVITGPRREVGVLHHHKPESCADTACAVLALDAQRADVEALGAPSSWTSGLSPWADDGWDWVQLLGASGSPKRVNFFGLSVLSDVDHTQVRGKEAWPHRADQLPHSWRASTLDALADRGQEGDVLFLPGHNGPGFALGGCPNLFRRECEQTTLGQGQHFSSADTDALDLLLHRALATRPDGTAGSWTFHLPALGRYALTEGCTVEERRWSGDPCSAARLQTWIFDVEARLIRAGLATWSTPSAVVP
jgi:hypothetical protein